MRVEILKFISYEPGFDEKGVRVRRSTWSYEAKAANGKLDILHLHKPYKKGAILEMRDERWL